MIDSVNVITVNGSKNINGFIENVNKALPDLASDLNIWEFAKIGKTNSASKCGTLDMALDTARSDHKCCDEVCQDIGRSHKEIIQDAYNKNQKIIMIFEDDSRFELPFDADKFNRIMNWAKENMNNWDMLYFGHFPLVPIGKRINKDLIYPQFPVLMHSYLVNRSGMEKVLNLVPKESLIDLKIAQLGESIKKVAVYPSMAIQNEPPHMYPLQNIMNFDKLNRFLEFIQFNIGYISIFLLILIIIVYLSKRKQH